MEQQAQPAKRQTNTTPAQASLKTLGISDVKGGAEVTLPRITIKYCTQCKWMLRAAYFAQELLQTFSTSLGEVALVPATGGVFTVSILPEKETAGRTPEYEEVVLWDRKTEGGFPETKRLKALVRDVIEPTRNLGHIDRSLNKAHASQSETPATKDEGEQPQQESEPKNTCEDCR
ncbi:hypothetical protein KEM56_001693 [Ascosphaera pollenicola]|nr:hypothetical protein KEM56_001693 [Ascosphaera pollenicola]